MKQLFEQVSSYWVRYDKYEIHTDANSVKYVTAAADARPDIFDPLADAQTMVLEALNVVRHFSGDKTPEIIREAALLQFLHHYCLLGSSRHCPQRPNPCFMKRSTCRRTTLSRRKH